MAGQPITNTPAGAHAPEYQTLLAETGSREVQVVRLETMRDLIIAKKP